MRTTDKLALDGGSPVRTSPLPWELPGAHWMGEEELDNVIRVVRARSPFRYYGPDLQHMADKLESEYCRRLGRSYALAVSSGTAALNVAWAALGIGPGDEVLIPGYLWVSCIGSVLRSGAIPRLVDIDGTFCMSPADLKAKITQNSRAVLFVHMSGAPGHIDQVAEICRDKGLRLVEDCAQANGASLNGRQVGTFGDVAIFSFQLNKNISSGEGGMLVCDDLAVYRRAFAVHDLGYPRTAGRLDTTDESCQLWGVGARMGELPAAMALAQLAKLDSITSSMRSAKWKIRRQLEGIRGLDFREIVDPSGDSGCFLITLYPDRETAVRFVQALRAEGIQGPPGSLVCLHMEEWGLHWYFNNVSLVRRRGVCPDGWPWTAPANAFAKEYLYGRGALPCCDDFASRAALLTIGSRLEDRDVDDIIQAFQKVAVHVLKKV